MYALNVGADGRCLSVTKANYAPAEAVMVQSLPDGNLYDYRYVNGLYVYDPVQMEIPDENDSENITVADMAAAILEGVNDV